MNIKGACAILAAGLMLGVGASGAGAQTIVVGGKNFTEQQIMAAIEARLGYTPDTVSEIE